MTMKLNVANGKYTFVQTRGNLPIEILRYGKPWHSQHDASNALLAIMAELDAARVVVEAAGLAIVAEAATGSSAGAMGIIKEALGKHSRLVDDREPPSEWTK